MILDIIVIILIALGAFIGYKKGLIGVLVGFISLILSIILAFMLQNPVANFLYNDTPIGRSIEQSVSSSFEKSLNNTDNETNIYESILKGINSNNDTTVGEQAVKQVTMFILKGISFIGILILVFIICYMLQMLLNLVFSLPLLDVVNNIGGIVVGALKALLKIWILLAIVSFLAPMPMMNVVTEFINKSSLTSFLFNNNFLVAIIKSTLKI